MSDGRFRFLYIPNTRVRILRRKKLAKKGVCEYNVYTITRVYGEKMDFTLLEKLTQLGGIAGREDTVRQEIFTHLQSLAQDIRTDTLGNLIAFKPGRGTKHIILCAHMDEVGLMINYISPDGFLYFVPVGGIDPRTLLAQRVHVHTKSGVLSGVIGTKPAHITQEAERGKAVPMADLFIDVGLSGAEAAEKVALGDFAVLDRPFAKLGEHRFSSKAFDDRVGCFCLLEALKRVKNPLYNIHIVFSSQEEVGLRGATTAAFGLEADLALAVDATGAADIPLCRPKDYIVCLGGGVALTALDARSITPQWLYEGLTDLCREQNIRWQTRIAPRGGNDAGALQASRTGMAVCALSVPTRNIHSNVEVVDARDIEATVDLLCAVLENGVNEK